MLTVFLMSVLHTTSHVDKRIVPTLLLKDNIVAIKQRGLFTQLDVLLSLGWLSTIVAYTIIRCSRSTERITVASLQQQNNSR